MQKTVVRIMAIILVLLMCLTLLPIRSRAEEGGSTPCIHPNLSDSGWAITQNPTCNSTGKKTQFCSDCNTMVEATIPVDPDAHNWVDKEGQTATCGVAGYTAYKECNNCGAVQGKNYVEPTGAHDMRDLVRDSALQTPADCTHKAVYMMSCYNCGANSSSTFEAGEPLGHSFGEWYGNTATCTEAGVKYHDCTRQGCSVTESEATEALGHNFGEWYGNTATCTEAGVKYHDCTRQGCSVTESEVTAALGHDWGDFSVTTSPTCTEKGIETRICNRCKIPETRFVNALGHHFEHNVCTNPGCTAKRAGVSLKVQGPGSGKINNFAVDSETEVIVNPGEVTITLIPNAGNKVSSITVNGTPQTDISTSFKVTATEGVDSTAVVATFAADETASGYSVNYGIYGPGTIWVNGTQVSDNQTVTYAGGTQINVEFRPNTGAVLDDVAFSGESINVQNNRHSFTAANSGSATVTAWFKVSSPTNRTVGPTQVVRVDDPAVAAKAAQLAATLASNYTNITGSDIKYAIFNVTPKWSDGTTISPADALTIVGGIPFTLQAPTGTSADTHNFQSYHYNGSDFDRGWQSLSGTTNYFSNFVSFAIPKTAKHYDPAKPTPAAPTVSAAPFINDGNTQKGMILDTTSAMAYKKEGETEWHYCDATPQTVKTPGTYYVRYYETPSANASPATKVVIGEYYTVKADHLYGKGTWYSSDWDPMEKGSNIYLIPKGSSITFKFNPAPGYWLHEINVNGKYVGSGNVKTTYTIPDVKAKTLISFGFSSSSSSPKTGDTNNILKWSAMEVFSLFGMAAITWYLFRKKEY